MNGSAKLGNVVVVKVGIPRDPEGEGMEEALDVFRRAIGKALGIEEPEPMEPPPGLLDFLGGIVAAKEREFITEALEGLVKENEELRKMCDEYRSAIEKLRAKVVEQDKVIEQLVAGNNLGKKVTLC